MLQLAAKLCGRYTVAIDAAKDAREAHKHSHKMASWKKRATWVTGTHSNSQSASHDSNSQGASHASNSQGASHDSNSTGASHASNSHGASHASNSQGASHASNSQGASHDSNSQGASHDSNSQGASHASNSQGASHDSNSQGARRLSLWSLATLHRGHEKRSCLCLAGVRKDWFILHASHSKTRMSGEHEENCPQTAIRNRATDSNREVMQTPCYTRQLKLCTGTTYS